MNSTKQFEKEGYTVVTSENIDEVFSSLSVSAIYFNRERKIGDFLLEETDYEHPFVVETSIENYLYINEDWYKSHLEEGREFLKKIILRNQSETLEILSPSLIDDSLLDSIKESKILKKVDFGYEYCLTIPVYEKLRDSSIETLATGSVVDELKDIYEPFIDYNWRRSLIDGKSYKRLLEAKYVKITQEEELEYFHLLPFNCEVVVRFEDEELLNKVLATNHPGTITIEVEDKRKFNQYLKTHSIENQKVVVLTDKENVPLPLYISSEEILENMVKGAEGLSPLEKYLYVYNIVKQYKEYNENEEDKGASRDLYQILQNEYMVCVGFSTMLVDLCTRVGIPACSISTAVDVSYDKSDAGKEQLEIPKPMEKGYHARTQVYIKDPKYKIDGYYLADATWDNNLNNDSYLYALLTVEERLAANRFVISSYLTGEEYFDCQSLDIFYAKINRALDLLEPEKEEKQDFFSTLSIVDGEIKIVSKSRREQITIRNLKRIIDMIIEELCILNPSYVAELKIQYPCLEDIERATVQDYYDVVTEIGNHIVPMCNKQISGADLFRAIKEVYAKCNGYTGEELSSKLVETLDYNKKNYERRFPTRTREYQDGHTDIYKSVPNKFDIPFPSNWNPQANLDQTVEEETAKLR